MIYCPDLVPTPEYKTLGRVPQQAPGDIALIEVMYLHQSLESSA
jgi:hypothetical protein